MLRLTKQKKKRVKRATGSLRKLRGPGMGQDAFRMTYSSLPSRVQFFPDRLNTFATVECAGTFSAATFAETYNLTGVCNLFGPRIGFSGSFAVNTPSGSKYLLSGLSDSNASAPYGSYIVKAVAIDFTLASNSISANSVPFVAGITYTTNLTGTQGMSTTQLPEQAKTRYGYVPHLTTNKPITISSETLLGDVVGLTPEEYRLQHASYASTTTVSALYPIYAQLWARPFDNATSGNYAFNIRFRFNIEFFNLNSFTTNQPTLRSEQKEPVGWFTK